MKQKCLIDHMIEAFGLHIGTVNRKATSTEATSLVKDTDGGVAYCDFSYSIVVGMLLYLSGLL